MTSSSYSFRLLGAFELVGPSGDVVFSAGKPLALVAYLAGARNRRASRGEVIALLWGEGDAEHGRASLRQALFALRSRISSSFVASDGEWLTLTSDLSVDSQAMMDAIAQADFARALEIYAGDFIPEFAAPGAASFERWADGERLRLRAGFLAASRSQLGVLQTNGDMGAAVALSGRLRDAEPDDDANWRSRFEILSLAGRFSVIEVEEQMLRAVRDDSGLSVEPTTEALLRRLRKVAIEVQHADRAAEVIAPHIPPHPEFQGRTDVFAQLLAAWRLISRGRAQHRTIFAPAGAGKTRLLRELGHRLASQRARVIYVGAHQGERDDAFAFLADIVARVAELPGALGIAPSAAAVLAGLVPALGDAFHVRPETSGLDSTELLRRRALAVADLIGTVSDETPLVMLLDDLQWADTPSLQAIQRSVARVPRAPLLVVGASRIELPGLGAAAERIGLPSLGRDEVLALIASIASADAPEWPDALTTRVHAASGGSPFGVLQFLRLAIAESAVRIADGRWEIIDETAAHRLLDRSATVVRRLQSIPQEDLETLTYLALSTDAIAASVLAGTLAHEGSALNESLFRLEADAFIVRVGADAWGIAHDLVAEATLAVSTPETKRRCAERLGDALSTSVSDLGAVRRVVRLLLDGERRDLALNVGEQWLAKQPRNAFTPSQFATLLIGARVDPSFESQLKRLVQRRQRRWRSPFLIATGSIAATLLVVGYALVRPATLASTSAMDPTEAIDTYGLYAAPPTVELRNTIGGVSRWRDGDTVRVDPVGESGRLRGRPFAVLRDGVALFDSLYPSLSTGNVVTDIQFSISGLQPIVLRRKVRGDSLSISAVLNGHHLSNGAMVLRVRPNDPIEGTVRFLYSTVNRSNLYVLARTTTWGRPQEDTLTIRSLFAGVSAAGFVWPLSLRAPDKPGDYWILWTHGAEPAAVWLLSGTNWQCGVPEWNDGNELAALPDSVLERAVRLHELSRQFLFCSGQQGIRRRPRTLPLAGIRVEVRDDR